MHELVVLFLHLLATVARLAGPGGARAVVAESLLVKQQLLILNRSRKRAPKLHLSDRIVAGLCALLMRSSRLAPVRHCPETLHPLEAPSSAEEAAISPAVLVRGAEEAGPQGTQPGRRGGRRRHETSESDVGVPPDRAIDRPGLRHSDEQGCGATHSRC